MKRFVFVTLLALMVFGATVLRGRLAHRALATATPLSPGPGRALPFRAGSPGTAEPTAREASLGFARPLAEGDVGLLHPDEQLEDGEIPPEDTDGGLRYSYTLRITRATLEPGQQLEAHLSVRSSGGGHVEAPITDVEVKQAATGYKEPGGRWTVRPDGDAQLLTWTPPDLPLDNGSRELIVTIHVAGKARIVSAPFVTRFSPPVRATDGATVALDDVALRIEVPMDAKSSWICQLSANLHDEGGRPLQHTSWVGPVGPGTRVPLEFSRALLDENGQSGLELSVRQFSGTCRSTSPDVDEAVTARIETVAEVHRFERPTGGTTAAAF